MGRLATATAVFICLSTLPVVGDDVEIHQQEKVEIMALTNVMTGISNGVLCNFTVDEVAVERLLVGRYGKAKTFTAYQLSFAMFMQGAMPAVTAGMGMMPTTQKERKAFCAQTMLNFGPTGKSVPGLLKPDGEK